MHELTLEIDSQIEAVSLACVAAHALFTHFSQTRLASYQLELCLDELLNNIIEHDLGFKKGTRIRIKLQFLRRVVCIEIRYRSQLADPSFWKNLRTVPDTENLADRGYGRLLVEELMDEIIQEQKKGYYSVTLRKKMGKNLSRKDRKTPRT